MKCGAINTSCMARSGDICLENLISDTPSCKNRLPLTNADRIRSMSDEELATEITKNPSIPCRMCEYYNHKLGHCDARRDFACVTAYAEALALDWLKQPVKEEHNEAD